VVGVIHAHLPAPSNSLSVHRQCAEYILTSATSSFTSPHPAPSSTLSAHILTSSIHSSSLSCHSQGGPHPMTKHIVNLNALDCHIECTSWSSGSPSPVQSLV
jgi:hypothetical protein